ncbi:MAG: DUF481 domain-containing protein [Edaphobacter sp.]|uniref:DUF481 domain-containing protein n=1 Tax=Edaphobacter sp. TaxID=1934404 RepID=UPI0023A7258D|nr:DUF481 domain-containing protein [Edaphobacter sp.]MDE1176492.1 DUF481 domain-containing protein [Edaphobacter sp.]
MKRDKNTIFLRGSVAIAIGLLTGAISPAMAQTKPAAPTPDVVVLTNGDQLTGTLERSVGDSITFKSDAVGEVTIPMSKVKELRSSSNFVVLKKDEKVTKQPKTPGGIEIENNAVKEAGSTGETIPSAKIGYVVDGATYNKELNGHPGPFSGWDGSINGGATVLQSTSYGQTFTLGVSLIRAIPSVAYLPLRTRTTFNVLETYGKLTQPTIPQTNPPTPAAVAKTSIFHTDFEHDKYLTSRFYVLGGLSYDHNYSQGMNWQQIYGGGAGYTILLDNVQQLDAKADLHYEKQSYIQTVVTTPNNNLIGSTFAENYRRTLPGKIQLTQSGTYIQSWNNTDAWSAIGALGLALPVYHRFALSVNLLDNYLNNPATGFNKNSLQFVTGVTYTLH